MKKLIQTLLHNLNRYKGFLLFALIYMLYFAIFHQGESNCLIKRMTGISCPLCGMTRSVYHLIQFDISTSIIYHPFIIVMPIIGVVFLFRGYQVIDYIFYSKFFWFIILVLYLGIYIVRISMYYPNVVPIEYLVTII